MSGKPNQQQISAELLERVYAQVEARVEARISSELEELRERCRNLEFRCEQLEEERDAWRNRYFQEEERARKAEGQLSLAHAEIKALKTTVAKQQAQIAKLNHQLYGRKSEVLKDAEPDKTPEPKRGRGARSGRKGSGRKERPNLPVQEVISNVDDPCCAACGLPYSEFSEAVTEQIDYRVRVVKLVHRRQKLKKSCHCSNQPIIKVGPPPLQLFHGSLFTIEFWQEILQDKFHLQRPLSRTLEVLNLHGLSVSQGTITNALKRLHDRQIFKPLVDGIEKRLRSANRWQMDETGWKVFQEIEGKTGFNWWLWVAITDDCCLFTLDPHRSGDVAKRILGEDAVGICTSDRLRAYGRLGEHVINSWCWAHLRRDILGLQVGKPERQNFVSAWLADVDRLFHLNNNRLASRSDKEFHDRDSQLRAALREFKRKVFALAKDKRTGEDLQKVFGSIARDWSGYALFLEHPVVPMDNNASERALRNAVVGRKNYYGSGSHWSGILAAQLFTVYETFRMNGLDPRATMLEYLYAVARNHGKPPPDAESFLPWNNPNPNLLTV